MTQSIIALVGMIVLVAMSRRANARFRHEARLPMQWLLDGSVTWTAPRRLALAFTPLLASCTLAVTVLMTLLLAPRSGQQGLEVPVVSLLVLTFLGIHALHLRLIARSLRK